MRKLSGLLLATSFLSACSLAPDFTLPPMELPEAYKEAPPAPAAEAELEDVKGVWKEAAPLEAINRGSWWTVFNDDALNALEKEAAEANQSLKAAAARVTQARAFAEANVPSILPNVDIGANAVRAQPSSAGVAAFGGPSGVSLNPYSLYGVQGTLSHEADIFGRVRDNYQAYLFDSDAAEAAYKNVLLSLQADVAQRYFSIRALDAERKLLRDTVAIREEATRIMKRRFEIGDAGEQDYARSVADLAAIRADLVALDRLRSVEEHSLAVLLGKTPFEFSMDEAPLDELPPQIPAGLPSSLLQRRPDVSAAISAMAAANARIGVARTAFFPRIILSASGGYEAASIGDIFEWSSRTWALGQLAGMAITMPIFDSGRNMARLDQVGAAYEESVANYRQQVLMAFKDVEDNLTHQRLLAEQSLHHDHAAEAAVRTTHLTQIRYDEGDTDFFQVVDAQRTSLAAERAAVQVRGQRFLTAVALIRALGGGWEHAPSDYTPLMLD